MTRTVTITYSSHHRHLDNPSGDRSYLGIVANWYDIDFEIHIVLIALPEIPGQHTGVNIARITSNVIDDYGICGKAGYFMCDSTSNNDAAMMELHELLINKYGEEMVTIQPAEHRLRCFGHILNLAAKYILFGSDSESFESQPI